MGGSNKYDVNVRAFIAFRENGSGHSSIQKFCQYMNMASPMTKKNYDNLTSDIHLAYVGASQESMLKASEEIRCRIIGTNSPGEMVADSDVSLDGTWQKRGHSSVNGVVMAISKETGKCVDVAVLSKECKACHY